MWLCSEEEENEVTAWPQAASVTLTDTQTQAHPMLAHMLTWNWNTEVLLAFKRAKVENDRFDFIIVSCTENKSSMKELIRHK